ncbi:MAG: hypothetical protein OXF88_23895 [Rhodobacteraceae bacterium]|nr:hypothetical protein [Paracoccaceae bacterium]MCY4140785.1 hypothetical protein [Paracoccaceae bacterium]
MVDGKSQGSVTLAAENTAEHTFIRILAAGLHDLGKQEGGLSYQGHLSSYLAGAVKAQQARQFLPQNEKDKLQASMDLLNLCLAEILMRSTDQT